MTQTQNILYNKALLIETSHITKAKTKLHIVQRSHMHIYLIYTGKSTNSHKSFELSNMNTVHKALSTPNNTVRQNRVQMKQECGLHWSYISPVNSSTTLKSVKF